MSIEIKQVIVVRKDLNMRKGKMCAQSGHAVAIVVRDLEAQWDPEKGYTNKLYEEWISGLQTKICVGVSSEQELLDIYKRALAANIPCSIVTDAGKTEFGGVPTKTCIALGPAESSEIDKITGSLTLL